MSLDHQDLPLPNYDHILLGHLPARIAPLDVDQVEQLIEYETLHANRLAVQAVLAHRKESLLGGVQPTGSIQTHYAEASPAASPSGVTPDSTNAPAINPPSHGDPTNPS